MKKNNPFIVGNPVVLAIDIQKGSFVTPPPDFHLPLMPDMIERMTRTRKIIDAARAADVPVIFFQEIHRASMIDFGRELDGSEGPHCVEGNPGTPIASDIVGLKKDDYVIQKRRYSCFFGTELEILLKAVKAETLILIGGFTDVCIHYTFVDGHQHDYHCRVVHDCVAGSSVRAHTAALEAMEYLQHGSNIDSAYAVDALARYAALRAG
ncbi:cysteine hydrolase family protein [Acetobacter sp.]|jgi:nicotinamidase-related amidase|uniref:cysteine hydrolase family protein n=1 Tax=Acetobacter sp. TaxID=440 RepID=UPI0025BC25E4|nr:isochorismatase family cysteine hydrolase [Acetobacter sp.]MCH4092332.1 cysteine hydrolase [Acetobacter sp.]MCI1300992.1 cysteine hydrolase [Acetobacter sp.]MCI1317236.1 cysteine hydrolase [Acetobacter sp.]